ncbi:MAG: helix-turn-helix transcriptional regulator [Bosea sp.]|uniref:ArsR/SmtB family transcription factor n=1 Tax=unclassified Bosea (in: a-proteobacteria) TaxID=2653178 RepID=UPI00095C1B39|nr:MULTISPECIES: metalloregulator ArsR/SmtB family transcription factor [unclassified Bosea (in: a-proteobacteria)]MBN9455947.1 helix-turn-helix transcriptional regulator [Bosea sp. (in: a-proteobacteria)]OJV05895.1 MAG: transcriptional regulator [Bosea sp. 67-29]
MSTDDEDDALFKALGHRTRRRMVDVLKGGPRTTGMLCELLPELDRCTVMQHLKVLEEAGLVIVERRGRERWNHLDALPIHGIHERWIGPYAAYAAAMLSRLKRMSEAGQAVAPAPREHKETGGV